MLKHLIIELLMTIMIINSNNFREKKLKINNPP